MSQEKKFIKTTDEDIAKKLSIYGFQLISQIGDLYTFLNYSSQKLNFEDIDEKRIVYDNVLSL